MSISPLINHGEIRFFRLAVPRTVAGSSSNDADDAATGAYANDRATAATVAGAVYPAGPLAAVGRAAASGPRAYAAGVSDTIGVDDGDDGDADDGEKVVGSVPRTLAGGEEAADYSEQGAAAGSTADPDATRAVRERRRGVGS